MWILKEEITARRTSKKGRKISKMHKAEFPEVFQKMYPQEIMID